jgi:hypothetical protein
MSFLLILLLSLNIFFLHSKQIKQNSKNICSLIDMFREKCWKEILKIPKYIIRNYEFYQNFPIEQYENELKLWYKRRLKKKLNLENPKNKLVKII